jgi:hypothetical protein
MSSACLTTIGRQIDLFCILGMRGASLPATRQIGGSAGVIADRLRRSAKDRMQPQSRLASGHCRYWACTFMQPDVAVTLLKPWCAISPGRAHSRLQADSVYMCGSVGFARAYWH